ncbi:MAG: polymer-forming cytoskeletal protein [Desulfobulbaceae bacterium]|nr:MAG: polymer-forming cytoskeletal protein [Desulfobulbaceae bacterium]
MGFWKKKDGADGDSAVITSIFDQEMTLWGNVSFKGKLRLDGRVQGNIRGDYLIVGEKGVVIGDILVNTLLCSGRVKGNVSAKKFQIFTGGVISGKVEATDLVVESGASLSGEIESRSKKLLLTAESSPSKDEGAIQIQAAAPRALAASCQPETAGATSPGSVITPKNNH